MNPGSLKGKRLGVFKDLLETDSIYRNTINKLKKQGAEIIEFTAPEVSMDGFLTLLNIDMKNDLPEISQQPTSKITKKFLCALLRRLLNLI